MTEGQQFNVLEGPVEERLLATRGELLKKPEIITCSLEPGHRRGAGRSSDLNVKLPEGTNTDFVWTWHSDCLVSSRALKAFSDKGLTGFSVRKTSVLNMCSTENCTEYWELMPIGWGGLAPSESGIELIEYCEVCRYTQYSALTNPSRLIDQKQWDGSDFFIVWPLPRFIFVSPRVREVIEEANLTGASMKLARSIRSRRAGTISPGRLEDYFPKSTVEKIQKLYDGIS